MKPNVVIGLYGPTLDKGGKKRKFRWRPSVGLCQQDHLPVSRFELITQEKFRRSAESMINDIAEVSPQTKVKLHIVEINDPWDLGEVYNALHDFAKKYPFEPEEEDYLIHITTGTHVAQICLFLLTEAHYFPGRLLQTSPSGDDHSGSSSIIDLDLSKYDHIATRFRKEQQESLVFLKSGIETRNKSFNHMIEQIEKVSIRSKAPMLIMGPTGAGKSQLAKRIYELKKHKRQVTGQFAEINCATLRGDAAMSALFGHVRGAFTGALTDRPGLLRTADKGMVFLDEVGELGLDEQAMLLRALEEKIFFPMGSDREVTSDFQLIAGTNRNLWTGVREGKFREDLLARMNLWTFTLPGLGERPEDIEPNLLYELDKFARESGYNVTFNREARTRYLSFGESAGGKWRANFRDLNASVTRMATLAPGGRINMDIVNEEIERLKMQWSEPEEDRFAILNQFLAYDDIENLDLFDRVQLAEVLRVCKKARSMADAGRTLFAASRSRRKTVNDSDRLRKYLSRFDLEPGDVIGV